MLHNLSLSSRLDITLCELRFHEAGLDLTVHCNLTAHVLLLLLLLKASWGCGGLRSMRVVTCPGASNRVDLGMPGNRYYETVFGQLPCSEI